MAVLLAVLMAPAISLAILADAPLERRRARRVCTRWFDERIRPAGRVVESDVAQ